MIVIIILLVIGGLLALNRKQTTSPEPTENNSGNEQTNTFPNTAKNSELGYSLSYPDSFTELTTADKDDLNSLGYIPPCSEDYTTCLYYSGNEFKGTNFDSAGLSIHVITDATKDTCEAYTGSFTLPDTTITTEKAGGVTLFVAKSGDAGAGHVAEETLYRTYHNNTCLEAVARTGYTQFGNYPAGSIEEFTDTDKKQLENIMKDMTHTLSFQ